MAIKISGNTVIDDSQNITATGSATFGGVGTGAESVKLIGRSSDDRADLQFYENDGSTFIASLSAQLDSMNLFLGSSSGELKITGSQTIFRSEIGAERARINSSGMGIGTTSPAATLHLNKSGNSDYTTLFLSNSGASGRSYQIGVGGSTAGAGYANNLYIYDNSVGQPRVVLDSSGNVKIGSTLSSPNINLNADGSATFNGETIVQGTGKFFLKRDDAGATTCAIRDDNLRIFDNPVSYDDFKISLEKDGSASFADYVTSSEGFYVSQTAAASGSSIFKSWYGSTTYVDILDDGGVSIARGNFQMDTAGIIQTNLYSAGNLNIDSTGSFSSPKIILNATNGSATFAGTINAGQVNISSSTGYGAQVEVLANAVTIKAQCQQTASQYTELFAGYMGTNKIFNVVANGDATFTGTITANSGYALSQLTELT